MNQIALIGRLTKAAELKKTPAGLSVTNFTVAVDRYTNGEKKADFIPCVAWRVLAENISRYFAKGDMIGICGSLQMHQYTDRDGKNRTTYEVLVERFDFCGGRRVSASEEQAIEEAKEAGFEQVEDDGDLPF